jgi:hypothetical protein
MSNNIFRATLVFEWDLRDEPYTNEDWTDLTPEEFLARLKDNAEEDISALAFTGDLMDCIEFEMVEVED